MKVEFQLHNETQLRRFHDAFIKLFSMSGNRIIGELMCDEEKFTATFTGRLDNLCHIWYIMGALADREAFKHNMFQEN